MLVIGGFVLATPGGGILPLSQWQMTGLGLALLVPTVALAWSFRAAGNAASAGSTLTARSQRESRSRRNPSLMSAR